MSETEALAWTAPTSPPRIALALSGGGTRAATFHLGLLLRLANQDLLEHVTEISTVSGGSLITAALFSRAGNRWPSSAEFRDRIYQDLRRLLTTRDLFSVGALLSPTGLLRHNLRLLNRRAEVLASRLSSEWGVSGRLADLPDNPRWWISAASFETGKNWRFSKREMGDWKFGRHYSPDVSIAAAATASAAVPYVIGALHLKVPSDGWYRTDPATRGPKEAIRPPSTVVRIWDGGAYDNLGLEALVKAGKPSADYDFLICSDASGVLEAPTSGGLLQLLKGNLVAPRLFDLMGDQVRALRSRILMREIETGTVRGVLVRMGNSVRDIDLKVGRSRLDYADYQTDQQARTAVGHATALNRLTEDEFDLLARHGFECSDATLAAHVGSEFDQQYGWAASNAAVD